MGIIDLNIKNERPKCPYCSSVESCEHVLLIIDQTFQTVEGGAFRTAFNDTWESLYDEDDANFDEHILFDDLVQELDNIADMQFEYDFDGGPGMSSTYVVYYVESSDKIKTAHMIFDQKKQSQM